MSLFDFWDPGGRINRDKDAPKIFFVPIGYFGHEEFNTFTEHKMATELFNLNWQVTRNEFPGMTDTELRQVLHFRRAALMRKLLGRDNKAGFKLVEASAEHFQNLAFNEVDGENIGVVRSLRNTFNRYHRDYFALYTVASNCGQSSPDASAIKPLMDKYPFQNANRYNWHVVVNALEGFVSPKKLRLFAKVHSNPKETFGDSFIDYGPYLKVALDNACLFINDWHRENSSAQLKKGVKINIDSFNPYNFLPEEVPNPVDAIEVGDDVDHSIEIGPTGNTIDRFEANATWKNPLPPWTDEEIQNSWKKWGRFAKKHKPVELPIDKEVHTVYVAQVGSSLETTTENEEKPLFDKVDVYDYKKDEDVDDDEAFNRLLEKMLENGLDEPMIFFENEDGALVALPSEGSSAAEGLSLALT